MAKEKLYKVTKHPITNEYTISAVINGRSVSIRTYKEKGERLSTMEKRAFQHLVDTYGRTK